MGNRRDIIFDEEGAALSSLLGSLVLMTGIFVLNFMSRIIFSPLMPTIESDLGIGHGEAGSLFLFISLGYFAAITGSGFVSSQLTHRKTIIVSAVALGTALVAVSFSRTLLGMRIGLIIVGLAAGLYLPSGISTITSMVREGDWGKAIAIHELGPNVSYVAAPVVTEALLRWFGWRYVLVCLGIASLSLGLVFARIGKGGRFYGESPRPETLKTLSSEVSFWIMVALFSLGISGSLGVYSMLPLYLVMARGMHGSWANYLVALSRISALGIAFVAGIVADRMGPKVALAGVFLGTGLVTVLLGIVPGSWIVLMVFLQPPLSTSFFPPGFAALSRVGPANVRNILVSFTIPAAFFLGGGAVPAGIGALAEDGFFGLGFCLVGGLIMSGFILLQYMRFSNE
jgi:NNP family nitrate/nitrite transporter-like MFS transporter